MTPVANPASVLAMVTTFEALPIVQVNDTSIQALANQIYNQGLSDGTAIPAPASVSSAQVVADLQALQTSDDAAIVALVSKYSAAPAS